MSRYFITAAFLVLVFTVFGQTTFKMGKNEIIRYSNPLCPLVEPHLAINPADNNHMVVAAIAFDPAPPTPVGKRIAVFATKDNGKTWKQTDLTMTHGADPWVAIRNDKDVVLVTLAGY